MALLWQQTIDGNHYEVRGPRSDYRQLFVATKEP